MTTSGLTGGLDPGRPASRAWLNSALALVMLGIAAAWVAVGLLGTPDASASSGDTGVGDQLLFICTLGGAHSGPGGASTPMALSLHLGGWALMIVAMMLPTSLPLIALFTRAVGSHRTRSLELALLVAGYVVAWLVVGAALFAGEVGLRAAVDAAGVPDEAGWIVPAATFVLAGLYQFTDLKSACLTACRSPRAFMVSHWRGRPLPRAIRLGWAHGLFCVGCCWTLMLVLFLVGHSSLAWMALLALLMAVEKNASWGGRVVAPVGVLLVGVGVATAATGLLG